MRISKEKIEERRLALLHKGCELMLQQGFGGTGVSQVAGETGMPKGSFFNYFDSKEDYVIQMLEQYTEAALMEMQKTLRNEKWSPLNRLKKYYRNNVTTFTRTLQYKGGCLLNILSLELSDNNDAISDKLKTCYERLTEELAHCIRQAQQSGEIGSHHRPKVLATFIDNSWRGFLTTGRSTKDKTAAKAFINYIFDYCLI